MSGVDSEDVPFGYGSGGKGWEHLPTGVDIYDLGNGTKYTKTVDKNGTWIGITEWHLHPATGNLCGGWVPFDVESEYLTPHGPKWQVHSYFPLTLSPSLLCTTCQHHGFIRNGAWEPC